MNSNVWSGNVVTTTECMYDFELNPGSLNNDCLINTPHWSATPQAARSTMEETGHLLIDLCSAGGPSLFVDKLELLKVLDETGLIYGLCKNVSWVVGAEDFLQLEISTGQPVLHPHV